MEVRQATSSEVPSTIFKAAVRGVSLAGGMDDGYLINQEHHELAAQDNALKWAFPAGLPLLLIEAIVIVRVSRRPPDHRKAIVSAVTQHPCDVGHTLNRSEGPVGHSRQLSALLLPLDTLLGHS